jgi:hypothetical protein
MELLRVATINILSVIDTDAIMANYEQNRFDRHNPQKVDTDTERMICAGSRSIVSGQGTAQLSFKARHGDHICFRGLSNSDNSAAAVIIYNIEQAEEDSIFKQFTSEVKSIAGAVVPNAAMPNGLPPLHEELNFSSFDSRIKRHGTEVLCIQFALYQLGNNGEEQRLYGYYEWEATITIS